MNQNPQYTVLRIKRKATEAPLSSLGAFGLLTAAFGLLTAASKAPEQFHRLRCPRLIPANNNSDRGAGTGTETARCEAARSV